MANYPVSAGWMQDYHSDEFDELMMNFRDENGAGMSDDEILKKFKVKFFRDTVTTLISCVWEGASPHTYTKDGWQPS